MHMGFDPWIAVRSPEEGTATHLYLPGESTAELRNDGLRNWLAARVGHDYTLAPTIPSTPAACPEEQSVTLQVAGKPWIRQP